MAPDMPATKGMSVIAWCESMNQNGVVASARPPRKPARRPKVRATPL